MSIYLVREFIKENDLKTGKDFKDVLKDLFAEILQEILEAELAHFSVYFNI
jgi:hypothetical protein